MKTLLLTRLIKKVSVIFTEMKLQIFFLILITIIGVNSADKTTNSQRFPIKILYDCKSTKNPSPSIIYDDKSNKLVGINHITPNKI